MLALLSERGWPTDLIDLATLPAEPLLARGEHPAVAAALSLVEEAGIIVLATPVYRATYTGLLMAFFDLMPTDFLVDKCCVIIATGAAPGHLLAVDHGLRPLVASLDGLSAAIGIYATDADFSGNQPGAELRAVLASAAEEAVRIATAGSVSDPAPQPAFLARRACPLRRQAEPGWRRSCTTPDRELVPLVRIAAGYSPRPVRNRASSRRVGESATPKRPSFGAVPCADG